ncbi:MAG: GNAT family N-acetyltransferase [Methylococcales bacterium]|nr:GNAT family N-acetyltransferase [Methylococcales bacterium]MBT7443116.1 GNAT family N-acetyltransferase [Methylococcales bacterium]
MNIVIQFVDKACIQSIVPLLCELDSSIPESVIQARLVDMLAHGYECVGLFDGEHLVGICGVWVLYKYYVGKHLELDNVFIKPEYRGQGLSAQLNEWLLALAESKGCEAIELNCYVDNALAKQFWSQNGFDLIGLHYQKK